MSEMEIDTCAKPGGLKPLPEETTCRPRRHGRLQDDEVSSLENTRDAERGGANRVEVGAVIRSDRSGYGDDEDVRRISPGPATEISGLDRRENERVKVTLLDAGTPRGEVSHDIRIHIQPVDGEAFRSQHAGGR